MYYGMFILIGFYGFEIAIFYHSRSKTESIIKELWWIPVTKNGKIIDCKDVWQLNVNTP